MLEAISKLKLIVAVGDLLDAIRKARRCMTGTK
jgi:hypothetical protein